MKCDLTENDDQFWIALNPETIAEAAVLVRFRLNAKKTPAEISIDASPDGTFASYVVFDSRKDKTGDISPK